MRHRLSTLTKLASALAISCSPAATRAVDADDAGRPSNDAAGAVVDAAEPQLDASSEGDAAVDATVAVDAGAPATSAVLTLRNDNFRTGASLNERILDVA